MRRNQLCKIILCLLLVQISILGIASAEIKEIITEGIYDMSDAETPSVAYERAVLNAKQKAVEQAGTYLESFTEVKNMRLTRDEIKIFASGIVETTVLDSKRTINEIGSLRFWVKARFTVNPDNIETMKSRMNDKKAVEDLAKAQIDIEKYMKEIEDLKGQLASAKNSQSKAVVEEKITQNEQSFTATQWYEKGLSYERKKDYYSALAAYNEAIKLNPQYAHAYFMRGDMYFKTGRPDLGIDDFNKARDLFIVYYSDIIQSNPNDSMAYWGRGHRYLEKEQYDLAIADYSKAIQLDPLNYYAYAGRGGAYKAKGQLELANADSLKAKEIQIPFYTRQIELYPQDLRWYHERGTEYYFRNQYELSNADFEKIIEMDPQNSTAYYSRGQNYFKLAYTFINGILQYDVSLLNLALADFNKYFELEPQDLYIIKDYRREILQILNRI